MKKMRFFWGLLMCYVPCVSAQILNFSASGNALNLPQGFINSLRVCAAYKQTVDDTDKGLTTRMQYEVLGYDSENKCRMAIQGSNNNGVKITQKCSLNKDLAAQYADTLERFMRKKYRPRKSREYDFILHDADYEAAVAIMENPRNCSFYREEIDNSAEIRRNLPDCTPAEQTEINANLQIQRQILGQYGEYCRIFYKVVELRENPYKENDFVSVEYPYECNFNDAQKDEFAEILAAGVIPAEEGLDFSAVQRFDSKEEIAFVIKNCEFKVSD